MDDTLRELERRFAAGDTSVKTQLMRARIRAGIPQFFYIYGRKHTVGGECKAGRCGRKFGVPLKPCSSCGGRVHAGTRFRSLAQLKLKRLCEDRGHTTIYRS